MSDTYVCKFIKNIFEGGDENVKEKEDKGVVPVDMVLKFAGMAFDAIPGVSKQGQKGVEMMLEGAILLGDDLSDEVDAALDVDG